MSKHAKHFKGIDTFPFCSSEIKFSEYHCALTSFILQYGIIKNINITDLRLRLTLRSYIKLLLMPNGHTLVLHKWQLSDWTKIHETIYRHVVVTITVKSHWTICASVTYFCAFSRCKMSFSPPTTRILIRDFSSSRSTIARCCTRLFFSFFFLRYFPPAHLALSRKDSFHNSFRPFFTSLVKNTAMYLIPLVTLLEIC